MLHYRVVIDLKLANENQMYFLDDLIRKINSFEKFMEEVKSFPYNNKNNKISHYVIDKTTNEKITRRACPEGGR